MRANETSKLKMKFYGFSAMLIISLLFTVIYSLILMGIINTGTTEISATWLPSVIIAEELNTATSNFRIAEISHVLAREKSVMQNYENSLTDISNEIDEMFIEYETRLIKDEIDEALIGQAKSLWNGYLLVHDRMISFSNNSDTTSAMNLMENESEIVFKEVCNVFQRLVTYNTNGANEADLKGDDLYESTYIVLALIILIAFGITYNFRILIQEIEKTQNELEHSNEEALLSSQAKSNFLANMSHEIRTPMNAISGMIDIILRESEDKTVVEYAHNVKRACDSLLFIINDVLDISKIESGKLDIVESKYCLSDVLNDVLTIANSRLEHKNLMFITNFQQDLPAKVIGDEVRVKQVMVNILNNAIKFTEEGHIAFDVKGTFANGKLNLEFRITDTGVGISQDSMDKLFEEFERVDTKKNRNIEGTGLGLAISKRLAQMMGGEIVVESELGKGTVFKVFISQKYTDYTPLAQVEGKKSVLVFESRELYRHSFQEACKQLSLKKIVSCSLQSELNEALLEHEFDFIFTTALYQHKIQEILNANNLSSKIVILVDNLEAKTKFDHSTLVLPVNSISVSNILNGKTVTNSHAGSYGNFIAPDCNVLVVDDNHVNLIVAQGLMKPYKFSIDTASNGQEAVDKIKQKEYDLVFMDHMMPVLDGIDATIAIRSMKEEYYQKLPIIALTANAIVGTQEIFINQGMNDFMDKPIKVERLNEVLKKWLPQDMQTAVDEKEKNNEVTNENETANIQIHEVDTELGIKRIGGNFDDYINILTHYHKDGVKKIPILNEFFENKASNDYKIEVHAIKSSSASLGAMSVSEKAGRLENACGVSDWEYVSINHKVFIDDFTTLLENISIALAEFASNDDDEIKLEGTNDKLIEILTKLKDALDFVDIALCEELLTEIFSYQWDDKSTENINKIKEFVDEYEYDDAIEIIDSVI